MQHRNKQKKTASNKGLMALRGSLPDMVGVGATHISSSQSVGRFWTMDCNIVPNAVVTASGAVAGVRAVEFTSSFIPNVTTRFANTFKEFRIIGARFVARQTTSAAGAGSGLMKIFLDEKSNSAPTASAATDAPGVELPLTYSPVGRSVTLDWIAHDLEDLDWEPCLTPGATPLWIKWFTDAATYGSNGACQVLISGAVRVQYRGFA